MQGERELDHRLAGCGDEMTLSPAGKRHGRRRNPWQMRDRRRDLATVGLELSGAYVDFLGEPPYRIRTRRMIHLVASCLPFGFLF